MDIYDVIQYIYNHPDVQVRQTISIGKLKTDNKYW